MEIRPDLIGSELKAEMLRARGRRGGRGYSMLDAGY
jgi:hypothetical protein